MAAKTKLKKWIRVLQSSSRLFQLRWASIWVFPTKSKLRRSPLILIKFDNVNRAMTAKKPTTEKSVLYVRFCFASFLVSVIFVVALCSLVALPCKAILVMRRSVRLMRKPTTWWKRRDEIVDRRYPYRGSHSLERSWPGLFKSWIAVSIG